MSYRILALVAASVLFATQAYAAKNLNTSRSNIYKQTTQTGGSQPKSMRAGGLKRLQTMRGQSGKGAAGVTAIKSGKSKTSGNSGQADGSTIKLCGSGDPLKGLNVTKSGGGRKGGPLCDD
jgi:hypothetical protein